MNKKVRLDIYTISCHYMFNQEMKIRIIRVSNRFGFMVCAVLCGQATLVPSLSDSIAVDLIVLALREEPLPFHHHKQTETAR